MITKPKPKGSGSGCNILNATNLTRNEIAYIFYESENILKA